MAKGGKQNNKTYLKCASRAQDIRKTKMKKRGKTHKDEIRKARLLKRFGFPFATFSCRFFLFPIGLRWVQYLQHAGLYFTRVTSSHQIYLRILGCTVHWK